MPKLFFMIGAILAGFCIAMQAPANSRLRSNLGGSFVNDSLYAAFFSICGTFMSICVAMLIVRPATPSWVNIRQAEWWNWIGGPLGAIFVFAGALLIRELGAALFVTLVVGGQLACSLVVDHFGLLGLPQQPMTLPRVIGAGLVVAGVVCLKYL